MVKQTYIKRDLIDYVDGEVTGPDGYGTTRPSWILHNLPAEASVQYWREGGYQGKLAFVIRLDGYVWLFNDYYGSCSGCDAFMDNERSYTEDMLRDAYCFPDGDAAMEYIRSTDDYSWNGVERAAENMINDKEYRLKNPKTKFIVHRKEESPEKYSGQVSGMRIEHEEEKDDSEI